MRFALRMVIGMAGGAAVGFVTGVLWGSKRTEAAEGDILEEEFYRIQADGVVVRTTSEDGEVTRNSFVPAHEVQESDLPDYVKAEFSSKSKQEEAPDEKKVSLVDATG